MISLLSVLDGLQFKRSMRAIFGCIISIFYTFFTIYYGFYHNTDNDVKIKVYKNNFVSIQSILSSSAQILALFFWRQTILSVFRTERCSLITYSPFIKWERNNNIIVHK